MRFENLEQAEAWRCANMELLSKLHSEVTAVEGVQYTDAWLCGASPSYVAGFNDADQIVVCVPI